MTLFVMSAFVAFNGFPGQDVQNPVGNLVLQERTAPVRVADPATMRPTHSATVSRRAAHHRSTARDAKGPTASTGLIKDRASAPTQTQTQAPAATSPASSTGSSQSALPVQQTTPQLPDTQVVPGVNVPKVQLPVIQAPSTSQQPVVDTTNAVTGLLSGQ
jgi:hypothetical protein